MRSRSRSQPLSPGHAACTGTYATRRLDGNRNSYRSASACGWAQEGSSDKGLTLRQIPQERRQRGSHWALRATGKPDAAIGERASILCRRDVVIRLRWLRGPRGTSPPNASPAPEPPRTAQLSIASTLTV